jgi:hypothetical protein
MWIEETIEKTAKEWAINLEEETYCYADVVDAFIAGAKYVINNTQS